MAIRAAVLFRDGFLAGILKTLRKIILDFEKIIDTSKIKFLKNRILVTNVDEQLIYFVQFLQLSFAALAYHE